MSRCTDKKSEPAHVGCYGAGINVSLRLFKFTGPFSAAIPHWLMRREAVLQLKPVSATRSANSFHGKRKHYEDKLNLV